MVWAFFACVFLLLLAGYPVAFTIGGVSIVFAILLDGFSFNLLPFRIFGIMENQMLMAVPLFVYMGVMLERSGVAEDLLETMAMLFGRLRGGMAISVVLVGALLAASTGIVGATVVTMGLMSLPTMLRRGYSAELATGTIAASGTLGQIIPPSIVLILLANVLANGNISGASSVVSVGSMFMGALVPGLMLVAMYVIWIIIVALIWPAAAPAMPAADVATFRGLGVISRVIRVILPPIGLIVAVLGSMFWGIASPTEAAAVGALGATVLTLLHGRLTLKTLNHVKRETTHLTTMVFVILMGATAFSLVFRHMGGDTYLRDQITQANLSPKQFLLLIMVIIFIAGFFIDFIEIIFIVVPVVAPILPPEINPLWLGILIAMNLQTSFLTPPFGFSLFYLKGVAPPEVRTTQIYRGVVPYIGIQILALLLVYFFPITVLWAQPKAHPAPGSHAAGIISASAPALPGGSSATGH